VTYTTSREFTLLNYTLKLNAKKKNEDECFIKKTVGKLQATGIRLNTLQEAVGCFALLIVLPRSLETVKLDISL